MKKYDNLKEIVKQLKWCNYECEAGTLENNIAFKALEEMAEKEEKICEKYENSNSEWHQFYCNEKCEECQYNKIKANNKEEK